MPPCCVFRAPLFDTGDHGKTRIPPVLKTAVQPDFHFTLAPAVCDKGPRLTHASWVSLVSRMMDHIPDTFLWVYFLCTFIYYLFIGMLVYRHACMEASVQLFSPSTM